jgi:TIR domain
LDRTALLAESRDSYVAAAARAGRRGAAGERYDVYLSFGPRERELAERIAAELTRRSLQVFLPSGDLVTGEELSFAADSQNLVVVVGESFGRAQLREVERFLRQALDEESEGLVIPVQAPGMYAGDLPKILAQFKAERLRDDSDDAIKTLAHRIVRDASATQATMSAPVSSPIMLDTIETLSDLTTWRLDKVRWLLVNECLDAVDQALEHDDYNALLATTADLELLSPSRVSRPESRSVVDIPPKTRDRVAAMIGRLEAGLLRSAGEGGPSS